ncbi:carboxymuconolactone decarboxylase family protein [Sinomonas notoginsengisoli]|uniref:carboxymuconolactone decarboxylase family protein n=1 Tax=Sinomonas notoginsengisoli TaxID=1457311 RepID=UPI001F1F6551|nr:carboxymuconolactone decarboxylase family protein [Sinomonas notoginsengisoli]
MTRIPVHTVENAPETSRPYAEKLERRMGRLMNIHAEMAHAPAVIAAYSGIQKAIAEHGTFDARIKEAIALAVGNQNGCDYCQASHTASGRRAGLSDEEMLAIRAGEVDFDPKLAAITEVSRAAAAQSGYVPEPVWQAALEAGWTESDLAEAFTYVMANMFTNYFNHYAGTELDVPAAPPLQT